MSEFLDLLSLVSKQAVKEYVRSLKAKSIMTELLKHSCSRQLDKEDSHFDWRSEDAYSVKKDESGVGIFTSPRSVDEKGKRVAKDLDNYLFLGPAGTGKTMVSNMLGKVLWLYGELRLGHTISTKGTALRADYDNQTSGLIDCYFKQAMGGVLFIDEFYAIMRTPDDKHGKEALDVIVSNIQSSRSFVVVLAGYEENVKQTLSANEGMPRRFRECVRFESYSPDELGRLFAKELEARNINVSWKFMKHVRRAFSARRAFWPRTFGEGGGMGNLAIVVYAELSKSMERSFATLTAVPDLTPEIFDSALALWESSLERLSSPDVSHGTPFPVVGVHGAGELLITDEDFAVLKSYGCKVSLDLEHRALEINGGDPELLWSSVLSPGCRVMEFPDHAQNRSMLARRSPVSDSNGPSGKKTLDFSQVHVDEKREKVESFRKSTGKDKEEEDSFSCDNSDHVDRAESSHSDDELDVGGEEPQVLRIVEKIKRGTQHVANLTVVTVNGNEYYIVVEVRKFLETTGLKGAGKYKNADFPENQKHEVKGSSLQLLKSALIELGRLSQSSASKLWLVETR